MSRLGAWFARHPEIVPHPRLRLVPSSTEAQREAICTDMLALSRKLKRGDKLLLEIAGRSVQLHDAIEDMQAKVAELVALQEWSK